LPSVEEFYLGDRYTLRGYAFDETDGDSGLAGLVELSQAYYPNSTVIERISATVFADFGIIDNNAPSAAEQGSEFLESAGVGLEVEMRNSLYFNGHIGVPLVDGPRTSAGDPSVYLAITKAW
jgi:hemolysin activation/secretion protein